MKTSKNTDKIENALYYMHNDTAKAIEIFDEILEREPDNTEAINGKGSSLMKLNRMRDAEKYFDYSLSIKKNTLCTYKQGNNMQKQKGIRTRSFLLQQGNTAQSRFEPNRYNT